MEKKVGRYINNLFSYVIIFRILCVAVNSSLNFFCYYCAEIHTSVADQVVNQTVFMNSKLII